MTSKSWLAARGDIVALPDTTESADTRVAADTPSLNLTITRPGR